MAHPVRTTLPVIDLAATFGSDPDAPRQVGRQLDAACREHGFFYIVGHGVPLALNTHLLTLSRRFFALPESVKRQWHIERSGIQRGFDPIGWQALDTETPTADLKESFYLGVDRSPTDPLVRAGVPHQGANQWPDEALVPGFQPTADAYAATLQRLARHLMGLMALGLGLPRDHFASSLRDPMPVLRLLHYPPQPAVDLSQPNRPIGCGAHTDWGALTLLSQDSAGGLQVQDLAGRWIDAPPIEGSFVVNLGDLMQRWTNDRWRSTPHRVVNTASGRDRYSLAYFFDIDYHAQVRPLPGCVDDAHPARYAPITAGEHITEMYRRTTLAAA